MKLFNKLTTCPRCTGRLFLDGATIGEEKVDLYCINCGGRKYVDPKTHLGTWIIKSYRDRAVLYG